LEEQLSNDVTLGVPLFDLLWKYVFAHPAFPTCFFSKLAYKIKTNDMWAVALGALNLQEKEREKTFYPRRVVLLRKFTQ